MSLLNVPAHCSASFSAVEEAVSELRGQRAEAEKALLAAQTAVPEAAYRVGRAPEFLSFFRDFGFST